MQIALWIDTPALGDTIAAIPTLRKISQAYNDQKITVFTSKPFLFEGHPLVEKALKSDADKSGYKVYKTFQHLVGKSYNQHGQDVEFRYSNMDLRQFHAVSLGFTLTEEEMDMDLYIESERELPVKDYVIIHPTHTWPTRTWDQEKWQELIDRLNDAGIPVVAVGRDAREVGFFNTDKPVMPINIKYGVNLLNDDANDPAQLRWMMNNRAKAVVTMDSGILHVAGTTDVNIIQLGSSIDNKLRAPYRHGSQDYKYQFVRGGCGEFCSSNMKYNVKVHGSIQGIPPQVRCLADKPTFECHPTVDQVFNAVIKLYHPKKIEPSRIAVMTMYDEKYKEMAKITAFDNFEKYCKLHGYSLEVFNITESNNLPVHWKKISYTKDLIESGKYDYVFFIDLDCVIMNLTKKLETFIGEDKHFLYIPNHNSVPDNEVFNGIGYGLMTGQFLVKNTPLAIDFLQDVLNAEETKDQYEVFDYEMRQVRISAGKTKFKNGIKVLPEREMNTFWYNDSPFTVFYNQEILNNIWQPGDFIVHITGAISPFERRLLQLSDMNYFSGGYASRFRYEDGKIYFCPLISIKEAVVIQIQNMETGKWHEYQFDDGFNINANCWVRHSIEGETKVIGSIRSTGEQIFMSILKK